ncbi:protein of unknown function DUF83 [Streptomyces sp. BpilaLS-43]|uniref:CRISPR-associated protein Cas4 n=1 Tax=Streptomyces sp. BpilaLS-43 TaxID=1839778 RepID=UPI00081B29A9|nr:Dna2/Cas4 domain-containing protein [Streptomyces sp. BpilaLS-43]SCD69367.1 protein of unknown function DUF83 [Streptomyces sp. BpilaLS-43]
MTTRAAASCPSSTSPAVTYREDRPISKPQHRPCACKRCSAVPSPQAVIYSVTDRRRHTITNDQTLRSRVLQTTHQVRNLLDRSQLPHPAADSRCRRCSLATDCMPKLLTGSGRYQRALTRLYRADDQDDE